MTNQNPESPAGWWRCLTFDQRKLFVIASAAWFFDCLDQRIFSLARNPALSDLVAPDTPYGVVQALGKNVTALFLLGWGCGGILFGALGDRWGRARMLKTTIMIYSLFTGLTFFCQSTASFAALRLFTGVGIGGVFGLAAALISETVPERSRTGALAMLQVLSAIGNISAALLMRGCDELQRVGVLVDGWRWMFLVGAVPAALAVLGGRSLAEPESWLELQREGKLLSGSIFAPYLALTRESRWRRHLTVGAILASTGVVGLWAVGEYAVDLQRIIFRDYFARLGRSGLETERAVSSAISTAYILNMIGAAAGMWTFARFTNVIGRRWSFAAGFALTLLVTLYTYGRMDSPTEAYWMMPVMGAAQLSVFAGLAIYLPELFPSAMRATGVSFCYNVGRFAAAAGSLVSAQLATELFGHLGSPLMERYSAMTMCSIFLVGLLVLPFAPETRGVPLPR